VLHATHQVVHDSDFWVDGQGAEDASMVKASVSNGALPVKPADIEFETKHSEELIA
jgi:hypothetical protein